MQPAGQLQLAALERTYPSWQNLQKCRWRGVRGDGTAASAL